MVKESLEAARNTHFVLLGLSAVLTVLLASERPSERYQRALDELSRFQGVARHTREVLNQSLDKTLDTFCDQQEEELAIFWTNLGKRLERLSIPNFAGRRSGHPGGPPTNADFYPRRVIYVSVPTSADSLETYAAFIESHMMAVAVPRWEHLLLSAEAALKPLAGRAMIDRVRTVVKPCWQVGDEACPGPEEPRKFEMTLVLKHPNKAGLEVEDEVSATAPMFLFSIPDMHFQEEFIVKGVARWVGRDVVALPALKSVWNEVRALTPQAAFGFLAQRREQTRRRASLLDVSLDEGVLVIFAPAASLSVLLYLLLTVQHVAALMLKGEPLGGFPWLGLYPSRLAGAITYSSVLAGPALILPLVLYEAWPIPPRTAWLSIGLTVAGLVTSGFLLAELRRIRGQIRFELELLPAPESSSPALINSAQQEIEFTSPQPGALEGAASPQPEEGVGVRSRASGTSEAATQNSTDADSGVRATRD